MSERVHGDRRRIDRLLSDDVQGKLADLDDQALLERRDAAVQEEADLSYVRRLLQGRLDLLRFERARRAGTVQADAPIGDAQDDEELVRALARVLTSGGGSGADEQGSAPAAGTPLVAGEPTSSGARRRAAEAAAEDITVSDPKQLDDAALADALDRFESLETEISTSRHQVQLITDALVAEVRRRVESGQLSPDVLQQPSV